MKLARRTAAQLRGRATTPTLRLRVCENLLLPKVSIAELEPLHRRLYDHDIDGRHYWIGTLYTLLMSEVDRRSNAAYFTPPHISKSIVAMLVKYGFDLKKHSVIDPAAGGASFLSTIAGQMRAARASALDVASRLAGMEIDTGLARLSESLIGDRLGVDVERGAVVQSRDSLSLRDCDQHDLVVANPPYGRLLSDQVLGKRWKNVCHAGHINKFALFTELCFRLAKPSGLVALVLPSSIVAGPFYDKLRTFIRTNGELLLLGSVPERDDVFVDVDQDISIIIARAGSAHRARKAVVFGQFPRGRAFKSMGSGRLPYEMGGAWTAPATNAGFPIGGATLADYGITVRAGYFVWNREGERMRTQKYSDHDVPLIWAENIQPGEFCWPSSRKRKGVDFVNFKERSRAIVRGDAIVLQRTTNSSQERRLVAARVSPSVKKDWGGFVGENHTIILTGPGPKILDQLCSLLNSASVDRRYRRLSGTASVSVKLLRMLDLPTPTALETALARNGNVESAIQAAYRASALARERAKA